MMAIIASTEAITPKMMVPVKSELGLEEVSMAVGVALLRAATSEWEGYEMVRLEASGAIVWEEGEGVDVSRC